MTAMEVAMSQGSTGVAQVGHSRRPRWGLTLVALALCGAGAFAACGADELPSGPVCGDGFCEQGEQGVCSDCGPPNSGPFCGDGRCEAGETFVSCINDCAWQANVCGNAVCETGESFSGCPSDCAEPTADCGNGRCEIGESTESCARDCPAPDPVCGNGVCESGESSYSCARDCAAPGPVCGNGVCESGESYATCTDDCGCLTNSNCPPLQVCAMSLADFTSECVAAYGSRYEVYVASVTIPETDGGSAWDFPGGLPDPRLVISVGGRATCTTNGATDTTRPVWTFNPPCVLTIDSSTNVGIDVYDIDVSADDLMFGCRGTLPATVLHSGGVRCESTDVQGHVEVDVVAIR